jgi:hypothetical protein
MNVVSPVTPEAAPKRARASPFKWEDPLLLDEAADRG